MAPDTEGGLPFRKAKAAGHTDSPPPPGVQERGPESREVMGRTLVTLPHVGPSLMNGQSDLGRRCDLLTLASW